MYQYPQFISGHKGAQVVNLQEKNGQLFADIYMADILLRKSVPVVVDPSVLGRERCYSIIDSHLRHVVLTTGLNGGGKYDRLIDSIVGLISVKENWQKVAGEFAREQEDNPGNDSSWFDKFLHTIKVVLDPTAAFEEFTEELEKMAREDLEQVKLECCRRDERIRALREDQEYRREIPRIRNRIQRLQNEIDALNNSISSLQGMIANARQEVLVVLPGRSEALCKEMENERQLLNQLKEVLPKMMDNPWVTDQHRRDASQMLERQRNNVRACEVKKQNLAEEFRVQMDAVDSYKNQINIKRENLVPLENELRELREQERVLNERSAKVRSCY